MRFTTALLLGVTVVSAGMAAISGKVVTASGETGIAGATVQLESGGQKATTDQNGNFTISAGSAVSRGLRNTAALRNLSAAIQGGRLLVSVAQGCPVQLSACDLRGRLLVTVRRTVEAGTHAFSLPATGAGVSLYRLKAGGNEIVLQAGISRATGTGPEAATGRAFAGSPLEKQAQSAETIEDVLAVTKDGYVDCRVAVANSDTSGFMVKMMTSAGTVADANGNVYQSVKIGKQVWTTQYLRATKYVDGTPIPEIRDSANWAEAKTPAYSFYDTTADTIQQKRFGAVYNWYVVDPANPKKIAPQGWHLPTDAEWDTLRDYLLANGYNWDGTRDTDRTAKSMAAQADWGTSWSVGMPGNNMPANNRSGFTSLPGGSRNNYGEFVGKRFNVLIWSSTDYLGTSAWGRYVCYQYDYLFRHYFSKNCGCYVRFVKD